MDPQPLETLVRAFNLASIAGPPIKWRCLRGTSSGRRAASAVGNWRMEAMRNGLST